MKVARQGPTPLSRGAALAGMGATFASIGLVRSRAAAAEFSYKLGVNLAQSHPQVVACLEAAARVKEDSGGRLEVAIFPNSALGNDTAMLTQVRAGALEFYQVPNSILANVIPAAGIDAVPFVFADSKQAWAAVDGPLRDYVRTAIAKTGLYSVTKIWDTGFKEIIGNHSITAPDDIKGLKLRITPSPVQVSLFKAFGAIPVAISYAEIYSALQTHLTDASESTLTSVEESKFYEVAKYLNLTNQNWVGMSMLANGDAWNRLPKPLQEIVQRDFDAAVMKSRAEVAAEHASVPAKLQSHGMTVTHSNFATFQAAVRTAGLYAQWRDTYGPDAWALLEKSVNTRLA